MCILATPSKLQRAAMTLPENSGAWSDISLWGKPKTEKYSYNLYNNLYSYYLYNTRAVVLAV